MEKGKCSSCPEKKMLVKNYRPISLLPIFGKLSERVIYNSLFNYFQSKRLFTPSQSGFLTGNSCIAQLLSIIHEIQTAFGKNPTVDVRGVFLDLSKAFDKVCHDGIIFKLKAYGVEGDLLSLLKNLESREQRFVLNGQTSEWRKIMSGIPQGSVLGALLFLVYINDLPDGINSLCKIFADDTSLFSKVHGIHKSANNLNLDLEKKYIGLISGKCSLIRILTNRLMKLFFLEKQVQITYHIHLSNLTIMTLLNAPIKST